MHLADVPVCAYIDCSYFQIRFFSFKIGQTCYRQVHKKSIISVKQTLFCSFLDYIFSFKRYTESKHIICHVTLEHCNVKYDLQKRKQFEDTISPSARPHTARLPPLHSTPHWNTVQTEMRHGWVMGTDNIPNQVSALKETEICGCLYVNNLKEKK